MRAQDAARAFVALIAFAIASGCTSQGDLTAANTHSPLVRAIERKDLPTARALLDKGADPLAKEEDGRTALDYAEAVGGGAGKGNSILALCLTYVTPTVTPGGRNDLARDISSFAVSRDGTRYAIGYGNGTTRLFSYPDAKLLLSWSPDRFVIGDYNHVLSMDVSPDGKLLAAGFEDGFARIWNIPMGTLLFELDNHGSAEWDKGVYTVTFSPDSRLLAAGGVGVVRLWDTGSGKKAAEVPLSSSDDTYTSYPCYAAAFSPDGRKLFTTVDDTLACASVTDGRLIARFPRQTDKVSLSGVRSPLVSPDGSTVSFLDADNSLYVVDCNSWSLVRKDDLPDGFAKQIYTESDGTTSSYPNTCLTFARSDGGTGGTWLDWGNSAAQIWDLSAKRFLATLTFYQDDVLLIRTPDGLAQTLPDSAFSSVLSFSVGQRQYDPDFFRPKYSRSGLFPLLKGARTAQEEIGYGGGGEAPEVPSGFIQVQGGTFVMGPPGSDMIHTVTLSYSFIVAKEEVTEGEWKVIMGTTAAARADDSLPLAQASWYEAIVYCNKKSLSEGLPPCYSLFGTTDPDKWGAIPKTAPSAWDAIRCDFRAEGYRLPTEAEWEYTARGGSQSHRYAYSGSDSAEDVAWYQANAGSVRKPGGTKKPNELGIYDMSGNVWEWCWDWFADYRPGTYTDPVGPGTGSQRILRGGSYSDSADSARVYARSYRTPAPASSSANVGFRVVRTWPY
jgi:formylglycine-generating enzyme required for sulfatase activity